MKEKIKTYALLACSIEEATRPTMADCDYEIMTTTDSNEILTYIEVAGISKEDHCIEIYWADEDGEFVEGSDYDNIDNFEKRMKEA